MRQLFESFKQSINALLLGSLYRARDKGQQSPSRWNAGRGQELVDSVCGLWVIVIVNKANGEWVQILLLYRLVKFYIIHSPEQTWSELEAIEHSMLTILEALANLG